MHADTGHKVRKLIDRFRGENGQALVELAFVIPLLLLFLFGIIDFGLAINQQNQDTNIANVAAREAAVGTNSSPVCGGTPQPTLTAWAKCEASAMGIPVTSVCVGDVSGSGYSSSYTGGTPIKVVVNSDLNWLKLITGQVGGFLKSTIGSSATMRLETTPSTTVDSYNNSPMTFLTSSTLCS